MSVSNSSVRVWPAIVRAVSGRCPACGGGKFFKSYLRQVDRCFVCDESFGQIHADDGPAWLTIGIVGHIVVPMALFAETNFQLAAVGWHDSLATDCVGAELDRPATGEGPVYCSDLGDEGSWRRISMVDYA